MGTRRSAEGRTALALRFLLADPRQRGNPLPKGPCGATMTDHRGRWAQDHHRLPATNGVPPRNPPDFGTSAARSNAG